MPGSTLRLGTRSDLVRSTWKRTLRHGTRALYEDAALYDALYRRWTRHARFYAELAARHGGPVLELGAGTGRVAVEIARRGVDVVGVEAVPAMLARARERLLRLPVAARERVTLVRTDMRRLALGRRFRLVIAPFNLFMHCYDASELQHALDVCRRNLAPGGRLAFDVLLPDLKRLAEPPGRLYSAGHVVVPEHRTRYRLREGGHYDAARQIRTTVLVLDPLTGAGRQRVIPLTQRQWFPAELVSCLDAAGFAVVHRFGDFERNALDAQSASQVIVARASMGTRSR
jgi:SAM-dependent methyltransferase